MTFEEEERQALQEPSGRQVEPLARPGVAVCEEHKFCCCPCKGRKTVRDATGAAAGDMCHTAKAA